MCHTEAASEEDSFDVEKEMLDVAKRVRDSSGMQVVLTPASKSPDLKRSRQFSPDVLEAPSQQGASQASSSAREMALDGLPHPLPPVSAVTPCKGTSAVEAPVPVKPPSPEKPAQLSPRNLMPALEVAPSQAVSSNVKCNL